MLIWIRLISRILESANFINRLAPILKKEKVASRKGRWLSIRVSRFRRMMGYRRPRCFRSLKCHHPHRQKILISRPKTHKIFNWQMPSKDRISSLRSRTYWKYWIIKSFLWATILARWCRRHLMSRRISIMWSFSTKTMAAVAEKINIRTNQVRIQNRIWRSRP